MSIIKKIGETIDGNVIAEIDSKLWERIITEGIDSILSAISYMEENKKLSEAWFSSDAHKILGPLYSRGVYNPIYGEFRNERFDGSIEQLSKIANAQFPFDSIRNFGKSKRKLLLNALEEFRKTDKA